ncbi:MAG: alpha/beta hydrolase [Myxococcales bacterium]|nr:alpha/beta hydrolase [Myxococcales bacterium]
MARTPAAVIVDAATAVAIPAGAATIAGRLWRPPAARALYVLGHGAGAGMHHPFMIAIAAALAERAIATLRWEMPAMTAGRRMADRPAVVRPLARAACVHAAALAPALPLIAGGKSMGGRMTSEAAAAAPIPGLRGLAFLGFPLHPAGAPAITRAAHLDAIALPMLFVSGGKDALATPALLAEVIERLGPRARLRVIAEADHGLEAPRKAGVDPIAIAADEIATWSDALPAAPVP